MKYSAVIVTLNRLNLLKLAIEKLQEQTHPLDNIVIVDNVSTDGTIDYLKTIESDFIQVIYNEKNEGGAGGFYRGIKKAYELGSDYIWIMDDDTIATPTALEELINAFTVLRDREVGFVTSNVLFKDNTPCFMNISNPVYLWNEFAHESLTRVGHCSFVSMMIPREVVRELGLPFKDFFIWGDDGEYSTRITQRYEGYICGKSIVYHYMNENKGVDIFNTPVNRINRFYYFYRNWMFTHKFRSADDARNYLKDTKRLIKEIRRGNTPHKREKIKTIKKGIRDGKKMKAVIDFPNGKPSQSGVYEPNNAFFRRVKKAAKKFLFKVDAKLDSKLTFTKCQYNRFKRVNCSKLKKASFILKGLMGAKLYAGERTSAFKKLMSNVKIDLSKNKTFYASLDIYKSWEIYGRQMDNSPSDYALIINNGLIDLKYKLTDKSTKFEKDINSIIDSIILYVNRVIKKVKHSSFKNKKNLLVWLNDFLDKPAQSLGDALQRIIILNQILWQTGHRLVGFGRLDYILNDLIQKDNSSDEEILYLLKEFFKAEHNYYVIKSDALVGDTGQIVILGGKNEDGTYFSNKLTKLFITAIKQLQLPDPKVLLRVSSEVLKDIFDEALECIATGVGCPLFSNDDRVIPALIDYGYDAKDAYNYTTSACWEPVPGNSNEQNNIQLINFAEPFELITHKDDISTIQSFDEYLWYYCTHMKGHAMWVARTLDSIAWAEDPLMSAFSISCREKKVDISEGGAKYNNYGILSIGIANAINSLMNIKKYVFEEKLFTLKELNEMRLNNFIGHEDVCKLLKNSANSFGSDKKKILDLTNYITSEVADHLSEYRNRFGGSVKFGLSSPSYLTIGKLSKATFDGRKEGEPYAVHISADSGVPYTELLSFISKLDYSKCRFNGNVADIMLSPAFINNNFDKFSSLIKKALQKGVFQMQFNVVSSDTLIAAKKNPNLMPNLVVRVWGFSAYFNELPEEYKDMLIERALQNESSAR